jgi:hypothetical protein
MSEQPTVTSTPAAPVTSPEVDSYVKTVATLSEGLRTSGHKIPENYKTAEDYVQALLTAQGEFTKARQELAALKSTAAPVISPKEKVELEPAKPDDGLTIRAPAPKPAPTPTTQLDWDRWEQAIAANGFTVPQEVREEIKTKVPGFTDGNIDRFVYGIQAVEQTQFTNMAQLVGGKENLRTLTEWAGKNLVKSAEEAAQLTAAIRGPTGHLVIKGLAAQYNEFAQEQANREPPAPARGAPVQGTPSQAQITPFNSEQEQTSALMDPKYRFDPNYRELVDAKIMASYMARQNRQ